MFWFILLAFFAIVLFLTQNAIGAEIYERKGYSRQKGAYWCLIPIYGFIHVLKAPSHKQLQKGALRRFYKPSEILIKFLTFTELTLVAVLIILPVIYMIGSSFARTSGLPTTFLPREYTLDNYKKLFDETDFWMWLANTASIAVLTMLISVVFVTGAGYVFARFKFKGKKLSLIAILVLQVFPSFMGMIAMFTLFETFGLLGKPLALVIIYVGGSIPFNVWLIKGYLQQIPRDLDESAMLDGANKWQIFTKIILPMAVPILSFVAVSQFMSPWMDYMLPRLLLDLKSTKENWTIALGLFDMISGPEKQNYTTFAAGAMIVAVPITLLYMIFQRYLITGITAGATKG
jgi:arabinogalactan oligomer/maltooligosaccharide transport system permease protein